MNYRRGFQRLYAVLTVAWAAVVCFAYQWTAQPNADAGDWFTQNAPPKSALGDVSAERMKLPPGAKLVTPEPPPGYTLDEPPGMRQFEMPPGMIPEPPPGHTLDKPPAQPDEFDQYKVKTAPSKNPVTPTATIRYAKGISIALIPSAFGYFMLFQVAPWIWRGFEPATHN